jgi:NitT/TauT family transport system permease protein
MIVLAAFVIAVDVVVTIVENRLLVWRPVVTEVGV